MTKIKLTFIFIFIFFCLITFFQSIAMACNHKNIFKGYFENQHYSYMSVPYENGTFINELLNSQKDFILADPQECFPDQINGMATNIRKYTNANWHSLKLKIKKNKNDDLINFLQNASPSINIGKFFKKISKIEFTFNPGEISYLDKTQFINIYPFISEKCHIYFSGETSANFYTFILSKIYSKSMSFKFINWIGKTIKINKNNIQDYLQLNPNIDWSIGNDYTVTINTPICVGTQAGLIDIENKILYKAGVYINTNPIMVYYSAAFGEGLDWR